MDFTEMYNDGTLGYILEKKRKAEERRVRKARKEEKAAGEQLLGGNQASQTNLLI